ncbi:xyloside xylosyltransferase 1 [Nematolebias whitei]|uniref:xyloside xylosyltransferase 1 n=1 Tax=Nematolebias whitei TaxID=451745 RepID=UPI001896AFFA|nr:xyloside xylosyltransferase 1 [Nematolebias whitei]
MGLLRLLAKIMGRISTFRSYQFVLLLAATLAVVAFYYFGSERHNFSSTTKRIKQTQVNSNRNDADLTVDTRITHLAEFEEQGGEERAERGGSEDFVLRKGDLKAGEQHYHALMMFTKVDRSKSLQDKFRVAMLSMVNYGRFLEGEVLVLHFVSDQASQELGQQMLQEFLQAASFKYEIFFHDVVELTHELFPIVEAMQKHFSAGSGAYYSDSIFFLSVAMHHIMPKKERTATFHCPYGTALPPIGAARHTFWQYRKENPNTRVGEPPPDGLPGFNSGVMLLDLSAMRASSLYNQLLKPNNVAKLADQYRFRGHLGDQDFFTMIGMEHPELFYSLACGWNRQLCTWWRDHGYGDVFQLYYRCDGPVYIYHGNCNSPIPED